MEDARAVARIREADTDLNAWAYLDENAEMPRDESVAAWPFGVKDVIHVRGMPTRCGLDFVDDRPADDAACVAALRRAGGVPIGKTHTTPMMWRDPAPTRNPHDPSRTPGGSSSGSAAAVGAGHVDVALATQTLGSILRPASFCGVVGFKPTFGRVSRAGVTPLSPSLDHVGVIARDVAAASRAMQALDAAIVHESIGRRYRIAIDTSAFGDVYGEEASAAVAACAERLARAGADVVAMPLRDVLAPFFEIVCTIAAHEALDTVAPRIAGQDAPPQLRALIETGRGLGATAYDDVLERRERAAAAYRERTSGFDVVCFVTAGGAPPRSSTGNGSAQAPASAMGLPAITLPAGRDRDGLPQGVQFVAPLGADGMLLGFAAWAETQLATREPSTR